MQQTCESNISISKRIRTNKIVRNICLTIAIILVILGMICFVIAAKRTPGIGTPGILTISEFSGLIGGVIGALWSFAGLLLIYIAFLGQLNQSYSQKAEFDQGLLENRRQRFENTFFSLMNNYNNMVQSITIDNLKKYSITEKHTFQGRICFKIFNDCLRIESDDHREFENILKIYAPFYSQFRFQFDHFYYNLLYIVKFVSESGKYVDEKVYLEFIRSQLSSYELIFLFYHCMGIKELREDMQLLLDKNILEYKTIQSLSSKFLLDKDHLNECFGK